MGKEDYSPLNNSLTVLPFNKENEPLIQAMLYGVHEIPINDDKEGGTVFIDNPFQGTGPKKLPRRDIAGRPVALISSQPSELEI